MSRYRRNADEGLRRLERLAAAGDLEAQLRLDVELVKLSRLPLYLPTKRIKAVVKAMLSPQEIVRLARGHDLRERYTWQELAAYLQEDPSTELVLPRIRKGSKVYSWEHDYYKRGIPSGWQQAVVAKIKKPESRGGDRVVMLRFPGSPDPDLLVPRSMSRLSKTPLEGELVKPPKVRRREQFKPGYDPGASYAALWLDETRIGTPLYGGLAYFWNHAYRHTMREIPDLARKAVHDTWLKHGLVLHGESPEHERLMRAVLRTPEGWHWEGGDLITGWEVAGPEHYLKRPGYRWRPPRVLPNRRNPDADLRELERRAHAGDERARAALERARERLKPSPSQIAESQAWEQLADNPHVKSFLLAAIRTTLNRFRQSSAERVLLRRDPILDQAYPTIMGGPLMDSIYDPAIDRASQQSLLIRQPEAHSFVRPVRGGYEVVVDIYLREVPDEDEVDQIYYMLESALEGRDEKLKQDADIEGSQGDWDVNVDYDEEEEEVNVTFSRPLELYHLTTLGMLDIEPDEPRGRPARRRRRRRR